MNKKYLMNGFAALALIASVSSCTKDVTAMSQEEIDAKAKENAELQLGFSIPDGQTWENASQVSANVSVGMTAGENYTVAIYSNNPVLDGFGTVMAKGAVAGGQRYTTNFSCPNAVSTVFVGVTDQSNHTIYKAGKVVNGQLSVDFSSSVGASRRAKGVTIDGMPFSFDSTDGLYKTKVPGGTPKVSDINSGEINGKSSFELTASETPYEIHCWSGSRDIYVSGNVTLNVLGDQTSFNQARIYVLPNATFTLNMSFYINDLEIYVAENGTLNYNASTLYKQTGGGKIYNKGTLNFVQDNFEANQNSIVYNEGKVTGTNITSKPGDGNKSFFYNFGELELEGKMELNSCANFYNEGSVKVKGETSVTQANIWWVNKGYYKTGSMKFGAWNETFYNYCQLIVEGNTKFTDGKFHLMDGSYVQTQTAGVDNFVFDMHNNSGVDIKGDTKWGRQGDGQPQGFYTTSDGDVAYVRLGGTNYIPSHKNGGAFHAEGANLTIAYGTDKLQFYNTISPESNVAFVDEKYDFDKITYSDPTTKKALEGISDARTTWDDTKCKQTTLESITFKEQKENECANSVEEHETPKVEKPQVWTYAFEDNKSKGDYDMNDVVLRVQYDYTESNGNITVNESKLNVWLVAAGATFKINMKIGTTDLFGGKEVHEVFGHQGEYYTINTGTRPGGSLTADSVFCQIVTPSDFNGDPNTLPVIIHVEGYNGTYDINFADQKTTPWAIMVPGYWKWPRELVNVREAYPGTEAGNVEGQDYYANSFAAWAATLDRDDTMKSWYKYPLSSKVITKIK